MLTPATNGNNIEIQGSVTKGNPGNRHWKLLNQFSLWFLRAKLIHKFMVFFIYPSEKYINWFKKMFQKLIKETNILIHNHHIQHNHMYYKNQEPFKQMLF